MHIIDKHATMIPILNKQQNERNIMFSGASEWLSSFTKTATGLLSSATQTARQAQQAIRTAKEYMDFLNEPADKLALTALNEAPQLLPPQYQNIITPITDQIPHTENKSDGKKQLADDFKTLGDKLKKIREDLQKNFYLTYSS